VRRRRPALTADSRAATTLGSKRETARERMHRGLVGAVGGDGIEGIGNGDDSRHQRNLVGCEAVGVAGAVEAFVVQFDSGEHFF
jgi:hypothetical protein